MIGLWFYLAGAAVWLVLGGRFWQQEAESGVYDPRTGPAVLLCAVFWPVATLLSVGAYLGREKKTPPTAGDKSREAS